MDQKFNRANNDKFYVEDASTWKAWSKKNYFINKPVEFRVVKNGVIIPAESYPKSYTPHIGGVYDLEGNFIEGHHERYNRPDLLTDNATMPQNITHIAETVVYGGVIYEHYGHLLAECFSRLWWFLENPGNDYKVVFISPHDTIIGKDLFSMLGLKKENIILLKEASSFDAVIVPDQSYYFYSGYTTKALMVFNAIRDSVIPADYKKVYLTRTNLPADTGQVVNEEYFVEYYRSLGYKIIAPEQLPIPEQVAVMAGAEDVVCISGTLQHQILFCQDGVNITVLQKKDEILEPQHWINQARKANGIFIDVSLNILPDGNWGTGWLFMPTVHWKRYISEHKLPDKSIGGDNIITLELLKTYIDCWTNAFIKIDTINEGFYYPFSLADVVIRMNKHLLGRDLDEAAREKLYDIFPSKRKMDRLIVTEKATEDEIRTELQIEYFCSRNQTTYIYGAGLEAKRWAAVMLKRNLLFEGFVVSYGQEKSDKLMGKKVYCLSEITKADIGFIIALNQKNTKEVLPVLKEKGLVNVLALNP